MNGKETENETKVCIANGGKCICGGKHIQYDDYTDPMCGLPLIDLMEEQKNELI